MSLDAAIVRRIAGLARIRIEDDEVAPLADQLGGILGWIEQLGEVDVDAVEPMAGGSTNVLPMRADAVTDGGIPERVLANAPDRAADWFAVPKVVE